MDKKPLQGISILLIDDEIELQKVIGTVLKLKGAEVSIASNGQEGLDQLSKRSFSIIITDIHMPVMSGKDFIVSARESGVTTPILCLSGYSDNSDEELTEAGATSQFCKPISSLELIEQIAEICNKKAAS